MGSTPDAERREALIEHLARGVGPSLSADLVGYARATVSRLRRRPDFQEAVECRRLELQEQVAEANRARAARASSPPPLPLPDVDEDMMAPPLSVDLIERYARLGLGVLVELAQHAEKETVRCSAAKSLAAMRRRVAPKAGAKLKFVRHDDDVALGDLAREVLGA
jgi:hypothetical protein